MTATCLYCGKPMQSQRNTKKYCSDQCKQQAFYKRNTLQPLTPNYVDNVTFNVNPPDCKNDVEIKNAHLAADTANVFGVPDSRPDTKMPPGYEPLLAVGNAHVVKEQKEVDYHWINSRIVDTIAETVSNSEALYMFLQPEKYWGAYTLSHVKWVSIRFRCLAESLIRLSQCSSASFETLYNVKEAFNALVKSRNFGCLPTSFPYTLLIKDLSKKLEEIATQHKHSTDIQFRLTLNRKVELIAIRHILADFVPLLKFSEMNFIE